MRYTHTERDAVTPYRIMIEDSLSSTGQVLETHALLETNVTLSESSYGPTIIMSMRSKFWRKQHEIFQDFQKEYPEICMKLRAFENCKPYFVVLARPQDRNPCCCC